MVLLDGQKKLGHIEVQIAELAKGQAKIVDVQGHLLDGQARLDARISQICQIVSASQAILDLTHRAVFNLEFHQILQVFTPKTLPGTTLSKVPPVSQRKPTMSDPRLEMRLRDWAGTGGVSILVLSAGIRSQKQTTELAADVINHLRAHAQ